MSGSIVYERKRKGKRKETRLDLVNTLFSKILDDLADLVRRVGETSDSGDKGAVPRSDLGSEASQRLAETEKEEKPMKAHLLTIRGRTRTRNFTGVDGVTDNFVEALLSGGGAVAHRVAAVQESASRTSREQRVLLRRHRGESVERATVGPAEMRVGVAHAGHEGAALAVEDASIGEVFRLEFLADGDDPLALDADVASVRFLAAMD